MLGKKNSGRLTLKFICELLVAFDRKSSTTTSNHHTTSDNTMASPLKRKRGTVDAKDASKREKLSNKSKNSALTSKALEQVGWDTAFNPPARTEELIHMNGINGDKLEIQRDSISPEAVDFEDFIKEDRKRLSRKEKQKLQAKQEAKIGKSPDIWKLSESIGGRMIDADPVFTPDER